MKTITTTNAAPAIGPYSQAIEANGFIFVSGQLGLDTQGNMPEGIEAQTQQSLTNIKTIIEEAGSTLENVVKTTILLADIADFPKVNEIYGSFFGDHKPARATYQVAALPKAGRIEIEAIAVL